MFYRYEEIELPFCEHEAKIINNDLWYCGYIKIEEDSPLYQKHFRDDIFNGIRVHRGITFSDKLTDGSNAFSDKITDGGNDWWLGFDCNHTGDNIIRQNRNYVLDELESFSKQISDLERDIRTGKKSL